MSTRYGHVVGLAPLLAAGCVGTGHASTAASGVSTSASAPTAPAKVVLVAIPPVRGRYPGDPPPRRASLPVRLYAAPGRVARVCDGVQRGIRPIVLCPTLLPRPTLPATPGRPLSQLETVRDPAGYELSYGSAWEPLSGAGWKSHPWRNRPCCFFHLTLTVYGRRTPDSYFPGPRAAERPIICGGYAARLYDGTIAGHIVVLFSRERVHYDVTEHSFGAGTLELLCRIVGSLRPAGRSP